MSKTSSTKHGTIILSGGFKLDCNDFKGTIEVSGTDLTEVDVTNLEDITKPDLPCFVQATSF